MRKIILAALFIVSSFAGTGQAGTLDPGFGNKGLVRTNFPSRDLNVIVNICNQLLLHPNGSFYLVIQIRLQTIVAHYHANGILDTTYGDKGYSVPIVISDARGALRPDGKIVLGGRPGKIDNSLNVDFNLSQLNADGSLDIGFGENGYVKTDFFNENDNLNNIALQSDGRIVAAGFTDSASIRCFALARYEPDGSLDNSFSGDGRQVSDLGQTYNIAFALAIQPNGRILMAGVSGDQYAVARYKQDGSADSSFNGNGERVIPIGDMSQAKALAVQSDGKIIVAGISNNAAMRNDLTILRLNADGSTDNGFSGDGIQTTDFGNTVDLLQSVALQPDGKIVVVGTTYIYEYLRDIVIVRYNVDGSLDHSFSEDGYLIRSIGEFSDDANSVVIQPDGKILIAGNTDLRLSYLVIRYQSDGTPDNSFGPDGLMTNFWPVGMASFTAIAVQEDGKIATLGSRTVLTAAGVGPQTFIARYKTNGELDSSFGDMGTQGLTFPASVVKMVIQPDGKYLIGGINFGFPATLFALGRYNQDGSIDSSFSGDGLILDSLATSNYLSSLAVQPDGKIIVSGSGYPTFGDDSYFFIARYNADGSRDNSFSGDGAVTINVNSWRDEAYAMVIRPDGKIMVIGNSGIYPSDILIVQFNQDGSPDPGFGNQGIVLFPQEMDNVIHTAVLQPDGRIVLGGVIDVNDSHDMLFMRLNTNGTPDSSFSDDGKQIIDLGWYLEYSNDMVIQPTGKIIAGGYVINVAGNYTNLLLVRLNVNGSLDSSFSKDGYLIHDFGYGDNVIRALALDSNRVYATGVTDYGSEQGFIAAYLLDKVAEPLLVVIPDTQAISRGVSENTVYTGYKPASSITLQAMVSGGAAPFSYSWSNGLTTRSISVSPLITTTYFVTVTDAAGQTSLASKEIKAVDVRCGNKMDKVTLFYERNKHRRDCHSICVVSQTVAFLLNNGWQLGHCTGSSEPDELKLIVYPNPSSYAFNVNIQSNSSQRVELIVRDICGRLVEKRIVSPNCIVQLGGSYRPGIYWIEARQGKVRETAKLFKLPR